MGLQNKNDILAKNSVWDKKWQDTVKTGYQDKSGPFG